MAHTAGCYCIAIDPVGRLVSSYKIIMSSFVFSPLYNILVYVKNMNNFNSSVACCYLFSLTITSWFHSKTRESYFSLWCHAIAACDANKFVRVSCKLFFVRTDMLNHSARILAGILLLEVQTPWSASGIFLRCSACGPLQSLSKLSLLSVIYYLFVHIWGW